MLVLVRVKQEVLWAGIHMTSGSIAAQLLVEGYILPTVASDVTHLRAVWAEHPAAAQG